MSSQLIGYSFYFNKKHNIIIVVVCVKFKISINLFLNSFINFLRKAKLPEAYSITAAQPPFLTM